MELNEDGFLEELLAIGRETWEINPTEMSDFFSNASGFNGFDENAVSVLPNSSFGDLHASIKPSWDCSFGEFYGPEMTCSSYANTLDRPPLPSQEDYSLSITKGQAKPDPRRDHHPSAEIPAVDPSLCVKRKNRVKKLEGQPSKNLMAERRRRKRLNDRLSMLRSVVPKISKMDRTSILGDTIDYMKELLEKTNILQEEMDEGSSQLNVMSIFNNLKSKDVLARDIPKFDVERRIGDTRIEICCAGKPGLLLSTVATLESMGLEIQQCVISCFSDFSLQASCSEESERRELLSLEDIKQELFRNAGYGGSCRL
ncbi:hypothetical protein Nepgr_005080 [Nepenthes gracilis]|uniref:BHLH domain-containing protein n=1 Tax=Nepenthes gracilis TaxID=150966 RepID=A0AAD3XG69_NEPGR|nr:hypothetical protein Nepgr_005080 [Nepenthes gracilis]